MKVRPGNAQKLPLGSFSISTVGPTTIRRTFAPPQTLPAPAVPLARYDLTAATDANPKKKKEDGNKTREAGRDVRKHGRRRKREKGIG